MNKILVIAEKPSAGMDIAYMLGCDERHDGYMEGHHHIVTWAVGHLIGLKEPHEHNEEYKKWSLEPLPFRFDIKDSLKVLEGTKKQFEIIKNLIHRPDVAGLINAGDAGREGYLIQEWIYRMAGNTKGKRVLWASSLDEEGLRKAFSTLKNPEEFDLLLEEAEARAEGDYSLGMNLTRALTMTVGNGQLLRYGRCQIAVLSEIVRRDEEIAAFKSVPYYNVKVYYEDKEKRQEEKKFFGTYVDEKGEAVRFLTEEEANTFGTALYSEDLTVASYDTVEKKVYAPQLHSLASLQQACAKSLHLSPEETLAAAQMLYENKLITYPRTDSRVLSSSIYGEIEKHFTAIDQYTYIRGNASDWIKSTKLSKKYVNDLKVTDHHAIIPTTNNYIYKNYHKFSNDVKLVYDLILRSFLAIFLEPYTYNSTTLKTSDSKGNIFLSRGVTPVSLGFKELYTGEHNMFTFHDEEKLDEGEAMFPSGIKVGDKLEIDNVSVTTGSTKPPKVYDDASIIKMMEKHNIGTSATRAEILSKLQDSKSAYIVRQKGKYTSTQLGRDYLSVIPEKLKGFELASWFEESLSKIGEGKLTKKEFLDSLHEVEVKYIEYFKSLPKMEKVGNVTSNISLTCPKCAGLVTGNAKGFFCENKDFKLWREMKFFDNTLKITDEVAKDLLSGSKKHLFKNLKGKKGKYSAYLKIELNGEYTNFKIDSYPRARPMIRR